MKKQDSSFPLKNLSETDVSSEKVIKLILKNLIDKYTLIKIISDIITVTKKKEDQLILKDKIPLSPEDIISIIYKNVGSVKLYQCLLELNQDKVEPVIHIEKNPSKKIKKEEFTFFPKLKSELISIKEERNVINSISKENDDIVVLDLNNSDEEQKNSNKNNKISLNENETIRNGNKTENTMLFKTKKKMKKKCPSPSKHNNGIYSESKRVKVNKKLGNICQKKLGFHYILDNGNIYKFKVKNVDKKENALFICDDINCKAIGKYSINNKTFKVIKGHNISKDDHSYNKNMNEQDMNIFNYMIQNNIEDLQLTKS